MLLMICQPTLVASFVDAKPFFFHFLSYCDIIPFPLPSHSSKNPNTNPLEPHPQADQRTHPRFSLPLSPSQTYADENHGLAGVKEHLYKTMNKFLADCYRPTIKELYVHIKKKKDLEEIGYL